MTDGQQSDPKKIPFLPFAIRNHKKQLSNIIVKIILAFKLFTLTSQFVYFKGCKLQAADWYTEFRETNVV